MAKLPQFSADLAAAPFVPYGRPAVSGERGLEGAGLQLLSAANKVTQTYVRDQARVVEADVLATHKDIALARMDAVNKLDELRKSGQPVGDEFRRYLDDRVQTIRDSRTTATGLQTADIHIANVVTDLGHVAAGVDAHIVGTNAKQDEEQTEQANGVTLQKDPGQLRRIVEENQARNMARLDVDIQLKQELIMHSNNAAAKNAVLGVIDQAPDGPYAALEMLHRREDETTRFLTPNDREALIGKSLTMIRVQEEEARIALAKQDRESRLANEWTMNQALQDIYAGKLDAAGLGALALKPDKNGRPSLEPPQFHTLLAYLEREAKEGPARTNPIWAQKVMAALDNRRATPEWITGLVGQGLISVSDGMRWRAEAKEGDTPLKAMRWSIFKGADLQFGVVLPLFATPEQQTAKKQYMMHLYDQEDAYKKAGKDPTEYYMSGQAEKDIMLFVPKGAGPPMTPQQQIIHDVNRRAPHTFSDGSISVYGGVGDWKDPNNWTVIVPATSVRQEQATPAIPSSSENPFPAPMEYKHNAPPVHGTEPAAPMEYKYNAPPVHGTEPAARLAPTPGTTTEPKKKPQGKAPAPYEPATAGERKAMIENLTQEAKDTAVKMQAAWDQRAYAIANDHRKQYEDAWIEFRKHQQKYNDLSKEIERLQNGTKR